MAAAPSANEIRLTRVYDAPVQAVWDAWTDPAQVAQWWGPRGFTLTTHHKDLRPGGTWRYTMHGPDGVDHPNLTTYHVVQPCQRLVYDHGATDDRPPLFRVSVTFTEAGGKTTMEMVSTLPTPEAAAEMARFIHKAGGNATWDRLAEHLAQRRGARPCFVLTRTLAAPVEQVFRMWTEPEHLARWLPPPGMQMRFLRPDIAAGRSALFSIAGPQGAMHVRADYLVIEPPARIVYTQQFVDAQGNLAPAPGADTWPDMLLTTVLFTPEPPGHTRVQVTCQPHGEASAAQTAAFVQERGGMTQGWTLSFDALQALLG